MTIDSKASSTSFDVNLSPQVMRACRRLSPSMWPSPSSNDLKALMTTSSSSEPPDCLSANMVNNMVKLMGPGASLIIVEFLLGSDATQLVESGAQIVLAEDAILVAIHQLESLLEFGHLLLTEHREDIAARTLDFLLLLRSR